MLSLWADKPWPRKFFPAFIWLLLIVVLLSIPGSDLPETPSFFSDIYLDKWVHAFLFGLLTSLCCRPIYYRSPTASFFLRASIRIAVAVSAFGLLTEYLQGHFVPRRESDLWDWVADSVGAVLALLDAKFLSRHLRK